LATVAGRSVGDAHDFSGQTLALRILGGPNHQCIRAWVSDTDRAGNRALL